MSLQDIAEMQKSQRAAHERCIHYERKKGLVISKTAAKKTSDFYSSSSSIRARERRMKEAVSLTLFSDIYMTAVLRDKSACQHVLRILTGSSSLQIKEVRTQYRISSLVSHDAVLDELPEVLLFYISKTDIWKGQKTIYLADRQLYDSQVPYNEGIHVFYLNAAVNDGSEIAKLMNYFCTADPQDTSQGALSRRVRFLKCEEGGRRFMCEISEKWYQEGVTDGRKAGRRQGKIQGKTQQAITYN